MSDIFTWRCTGGRWEPREGLDRCSHCGSIRPSEALRLIKEEGATITPTDKNYKLYVRHSTKCYTNHFSEEQAVELVTLVETGKAKLEYPGHFYRGLAFVEYKEAINAAVTAIRGVEALSPEPVPPSAAVPEIPDYEKVWNEFWRPLVEKPDGSLDLDQLKRELFDFRTAMENVGKVYCHITGNLISKINTDADAVISVADDYAEKLAIQKVQDDFDDAGFRTIPEPVFTLWLGALGVSFGKVKHPRSE